MYVHVSVIPGVWIVSLYSSSCSLMLWTRALPLPYPLSYVSNTVGLVARITTKLLIINPPATIDTRTMLPLLAGNLPRIT
jgi:hypothetical protein